MSRILLADDSPHAQRMGERILREEGFEVISVTDGETAMVRLEDVNPDVIVADAFLPKRSGFDICRDVKGNPKFRHVRVVLTAGVLEPLDEEEASQAGSDALLKKPFEASVVMDTIRPLAEAARLARNQDHSAAAVEPEPEPEPEPAPIPAPAGLSQADEERVRAAVTLALEAAMPAMIDEITLHVLIALKKLR
ncbi:MAG: response regulator [Acidobacteria bacterium]|nr:response regulator [Acidobacteriota bacterium]